MSFKQICWGYKQHYFKIQPSTGRLTCQAWQKGKDCMTAICGKVSLPDDGHPEGTQGLGEAELKQDTGSLLGFPTNSPAVLCKTRLKMSVYAVDNVWGERVQWICLFPIVSATVWSLSHISWCACCASWSSSCWVSVPQCYSSLFSFMCLIPVLFQYGVISLQDLDHPLPPQGDCCLSKLSPLRGI